MELFSSYSLVCGRVPPPGRCGRQDPNQLDQLKFLPRFARGTPLTPSVSLTVFKLFTKNRFTTKEMLLGVENGFTQKNDLKITLQNSARSLSRTDISYSPEWRTRPEMTFQMKEVCRFTSELFNCKLSVPYLSKVIAIFYRRSTVETNLSPLGTSGSELSRRLLIST